MFTTAGNTLPTAKTAGSEAGSACAKQDTDRASIQGPASPQIACLGSTRVLRAGFGVAPKQSFLCLPPAADRRVLGGKFAIAKTRSPARGTRALPTVRDAALIVAP